MGQKERHLEQIKMCD